MRLTVNIMYVVHKLQPSLKKTHAYGNDVRPVKRKQNCAFSERGPWITCKIIEDAGNKKKNHKKPEACPRLM